MKRHALAAALALLFAGAAQAADTEFILYQKPDFKGPSQVVKGEVNILEGGFIREAESLIVRGGYWEACTEDRFKGTCRVYDPGQYARLGDLANKIVSVRFLGTDYAVARREADRVAKLEAERVAANAPPPAREMRSDERDYRRDERDYRRDERDYRQDRGNYRRGVIELYGREEFNGRSTRIDENVPDLRERNFGGRASSVVVHRGTWELCTREDFAGRCRTFGPGEYPQLAGLDNRVTSLRQVR
jgi:hypothetical protein